MPNNSEDLVDTSTAHCVYLVWYPANSNFYPANLDFRDHVCYVGEGLKARPYRDFRQDANRELSRLAHNTPGPLEVTIVQTGLTKRAAKTLEQAIIRHLKAQYAEGILLNSTGQLTDFTPNVRHESYRWVEDIIEEIAERKANPFGADNQLTVALRSPTKAATQRHWAPPPMSLSMKQLIVEFLSRTPSSRDKRRLLEGEAYIDDEDLVYFRLKNLQRYVDHATKQGTYTQRNLTAELRLMGGGEKFFNISQKGVSCWWVPEKEYNLRNTVPT